MCVYFSLEKRQTFTYCAKVRVKYLFGGRFSTHRENYKAANLIEHLEHFVWVEQVGATGLQAARQMGHGRPTLFWCFCHKQ
jgi:hypothetical protein